MKIIINMALLAVQENTVWFCWFCFVSDRHFVSNIAYADKCTNTVH